MTLLFKKILKYSICFALLVAFCFCFALLLYSPVVVASADVATPVSPVPRSPMSVFLEGQNQFDGELGTNGYPSTSYTASNPYQGKWGVYIVMNAPVLTSMLIGGEYMLFGWTGAVPTPGYSWDNGFGVWGADTAGGTKYLGYKINGKKYPLVTYDYNTTVLNWVNYGDGVYASYIRFNDEYGLGNSYMYVDVPYDLVYVRNNINSNFRNAVTLYNPNQQIISFYNASWLSGTQSDISYEQGYNQGYEDGINTSLNNTGFYQLLGAVVESPITALFGVRGENGQRVGGLLNFTLMGVNLGAFFLSLLSVCVVLVFVRIALSGRVKG